MFEKVRPNHDLSNAIIAVAGLGIATATCVAVPDVLTYQKESDNLAVALKEREKHVKDQEMLLAIDAGHSAVRAVMNVNNAHEHIVRSGIEVFGCLAVGALGAMIRKKEQDIALLLSQQTEQPSE